METLPHVLNHCLTHSAARTLRHDDVIKLLSDATSGKWLIAQNGSIPGTQSPLRPELVLNEGDEENNHVN